MRFRPRCRRPRWIVGGAADRAVLLPLLHGRLRPAAGDHAPRRAPGLRAGADLPGLLRAQAQASEPPPRSTAARRAACRWSTGCWAWRCVVSVLYIPCVFDDLAFRVGNPSLSDVVFGSILIVTLLEATRRSMGWPLPLIAIGFIALRIGRPVLPRPAQACRRDLVAAGQPPVPHQPGHLRRGGGRGGDLRLPLRAVRRDGHAHRPRASCSSTSPPPWPAATPAGRPRSASSARRCSACSRAPRSPTRSRWAR